jgi:NADH-quinone oxidoreductase subunit F
VPTSGWSAAPAGVEDMAPASNPTVVNNVETLATVSLVLAKGPEWHRSLGTPESPGTIVATVVGDVVRPGVGQVEMGTPLRDVIEQVGGGVRPGRTIKAVMSGVANPVLTGGRLDTPCSYEGMAAAGSGLGAAGFLVLDDTASMVEVARELSRFLYVESCGQCPACKLGTGAVTERLATLAAGAAAPDDLDAVAFRLQTVTDGNRCYLPVQERLVVSSILQAFPEEVAEALDGRPRPERGFTVPKLLDLTDGVATYDPRQALKRPDWTYADE